MADTLSSEEIRGRLAELAASEERLALANPFKPHTSHYSLHRQYLVGVLKLPGFQQRFVDQVLREKAPLVDYAASALAVSDALVAVGLARLSDARKVRFIELLDRMASVADEKTCAALFKRIGSSEASSVLAGFGTNDVADFYQLKGLALRLALSKERQNSPLTAEQRAKADSAITQSLSKRLPPEQLGRHAQVAKNLAAHEDGEACWAGRLNATTVLQQQGALRTWAVRGWFSQL